MIEITINALNATRTVAVEAINENGTAFTIRDLCHQPAVVDFFDAEPAEIIDAVAAVDGVELPERFRNNILDGAVETGSTIDFGIDAAEDDDDDDAEDASDESAATGTCTVLASGGFVSVSVAVTAGVTTLRDVIYNDAVRTRTGMTDAQLSNCVVVVNDNAVAADALDTTHMNPGDIVAISLRVAHTKGC